MFKDSKIDKEKYTELIESLKELNVEYFKVRKDGNYKLGYAIKEAIRSIIRLDLVSLYRHFTFFIKQQEEKKIPTKSLGNVSYPRKASYFTNERIAVYTAVFGKYDEIQEPLVSPDNIDYYIITDQEVPADSSWKKIKLSDLNINLDSYDNVMKNRFVKMFPDKIFNNYDYSIYIDGNIKVISDLSEYIHRIGNKGLSIHSHGKRDCVYQEAKAIKIYKKEKKETVDNYLKLLKSRSFPEKFGLLECNVIVRQHHHEICQKVMKEWWIEFSKHIKRDQLSLPYVLYKNKIEVNDISLLGENIYTNPSFRIVSHNDKIS